jgi:hypothetical protein
LTAQPHYSFRGWRSWLSKPNSDSPPSRSLRLTARERGAPGRLRQAFPGEMIAAPFCSKSAYLAGVARSLDPLSTSHTPHAPRILHGWQVQGLTRAPRRALAHLNPGARTGDLTSLCSWYTSTPSQWVHAARCGRWASLFLWMYFYCVDLSCSEDMGAQQRPEIDISAGRACRREGCIEIQIGLGWESAEGQWRGET